MTTPILLRTYPRKAQVAELVDALVSGTSAARREGSSPFLGTKVRRMIPKSGNRFSEKIMRKQKATLRCVSSALCVPYCAC